MVKTLNDFLAHQSYFPVSDTFKPPVEANAISSYYYVSLRTKDSRNLLWKSWRNPSADSLTLLDLFLISNLELVRKKLD